MAFSLLFKVRQLCNTNSAVVNLTSTDNCEDKIRSCRNRIFRHKLIDDVAAAANFKMLFRLNRIIFIAVVTIAFGHQLMAVLAYVCVCVCETSPR